MYYFFQSSYGPHAAYYFLSSVYCSSLSCRGHIIPPEQQLSLFFVHVYSLVGDFSSRLLVVGSPNYGVDMLDIKTLNKQFHALEL